MTLKLVPRSCSCGSTEVEARTPHKDKQKVTRVGLAEGLHRQFAAQRGLTQCLSALKQAQARGEFVADYRVASLRNGAALGRAIVSLAVGSTRTRRGFAQTAKEETAS